MTHRLICRVGMRRCRRFLNPVNVYFLPEYIRLFKKDGTGAARFFVYQDGVQVWGNAVLVRAATDAENAPQDVETAYGYGGPISSSDDSAFLADAHAAYNTWLGQSGVMVEFMRLHPLLQNGKWCSPDMTVDAVSKTLSIGLDAPPVFKGRKQQLQTCVDSGRRGAGV